MDSRGISSVAISVVIALSALQCGCSRKQKTPQPLFVHEANHSVELAKFSKSNEQCLVVAPDRLYVLSAKDGSVESEIELENYDFMNNSFHWAEFADGPKVYASNSDSTSITLYDAGSGSKGKVTQTIGKFKKTPTAIQSTELANKILLREDYKTWHLYDVKENKSDWQIDFKSRLMSYRYCYRHPMLAGMQGEDEVVIADISTGKKLDHLIQHKDCVRGIDISRDHRYVVTGNETGTATVYDLESKKVVWTCYVDRDGAFGVSIHPDNDLIAVGCMRGIKILSLKKKTIIAGWHGHSWFVDSLEFSKDGHYLLSASADRRTKLWKTSEILVGNTYETQRFNFDN